MPYKSKKQAAYMHIHMPKLAKKWDREGAKVVPTKKAPPKKK